MGGKNSMWNKPLGAGKGSVNKVAEDALGPTGKRITDAAVGWSVAGPYGLISSQGGLKGVKENTGKILEDTGILAKKEEAPSTGNVNLDAALKKGEDYASRLTGATMDQIGQERGKVRQQYQDILSGNSIVANTMRQDRNAMERQAKAQQAVSGGGGQMAAAQQNAMQRQAAQDIAQARSQEYRDTLDKMEAQWRGAASDTSKSIGQMGSLVVGSQQIPTIQSDQGLFGRLFGGLF